MKTMSFIVPTLLIGIFINILLLAYNWDDMIEHNYSVELESVEVIDTVQISKAQKEALKRGLKFLDSLYNTPENRYKRYQEDSVKKDKLIRSWQQFI